MRWKAAKCLCCASCRLKLACRACKAGPRCLSSHAPLMRCTVQTAERHASRDQETREALGVRLDGAVVVVDEAHNLVRAPAACHSVLLAQVACACAKSNLLCYRITNHMLFAAGLCRVMSEVRGQHCGYAEGQGTFPCTTTSRLWACFRPSLMHMS